MQKAPQEAMIGLSALLLISAPLGYFLGSISWGVVAGLLIWVYRQLRVTIKLQKWLQETDQPPPEAKGFWGDIFDDLAHLQRRHQTRTRELKEIISRFQQSSTALPDAVAIIDKHNNLEWWNKAADQLLGLSPAADRGKPVINLLRDPRFIRYYRKDSYDEPLQLPSPVEDGRILQYQITRFNVHDRLLVARDITQLTRLEHTRQDFVANASHELRTPLTVIRGYLETFLDQEQPPAMQRALRQMQLQAQRMESLVADLLLLSRLEASQHIADERPVDVRSMLKNIREDALALSDDKAHTIELEIDSSHDLLGQAQELHSAFSNLIYNAVRYTPEKGQIIVRWWSDETGGHLSVSDNGIGIDAVHLDRLTERFYRVDKGRSSATGGTGLGLAIVKHALQRHHAKLIIESQPSNGSTFSCHFPPDLLIRA